MKKNNAMIRFLIILAILAYFIVMNFQAFVNILLVLIGFGAVVFIHELGHFSVGKLTGMNVQAFCLGFHPLLIGVFRTEKGLKVRILPKFFPTEGQVGEEGDGKLSFTIPLKKSKAGETEYRIGIIPFGGFVKVLGQEDAGVAAETNDPRAFMNKPISARIAMVSAGVIFNAISAIVIFMITFMIGVELPPAVVGDVLPGSPAAMAGLKPGDRILEINGKQTFDFSDVMLAGPLSGKNETIHFKLQSADGEIYEADIAARDEAGQKLRTIGVSSATSLEIGKLPEPAERERLTKETGMQGGDIITAVNDEPVKTFWEFMDKVNALSAETVKISFKTTDGQIKDTVLGFDYVLPTSSIQDPNSESQLGSFYGILPRLKIANTVNADKKGVISKIKGVFGAQKFQGGDIIVKVADVEHPNFKDLRDQTRKYENLNMPIKVLRKDNAGEYRELTISAIPKANPQTGTVLLGIPLEFDMESPVIAGTIAAGDSNGLQIPVGAKLTAVNGNAVGSFNDFVGMVRRNLGSEIALEFVNPDGSTGKADFVAAEDDFPAAAVIGGDIPFVPLKEIKKTDKPLEALSMGFKKTADLIITTYMTLKQLALGLVSPAALSGPVGIVSISYRIVSEQSFVYYLYFMALISACIAVFNFLPLPIMDGGVVVLLIIEKLKGSPISARTQGIINYVGLVMIIGIFVLVTFNDIRNLFVQ